MGSYDSPIELYTGCRGHPCKPTAGFTYNYVPHAPRPDPSCDTIVVLAPHTRAGATILAKNSDRAPYECQPLAQVPHRVHRESATVQSQYLEIPQVAETAAVIGSRPFWLWGFEHGLNEYGVAIGNEAVLTRETLPATGLLGMDLVRLGLERSKTAREATEVVGTLIERYGQGGASRPACSTWRLPKRSLRSSASHGPQRQGTARHGRGHAGRLAVGVRPGPQDHPRRRRRTRRCCGAADSVRPMPGYPPVRCPRWSPMAWSPSAIWSLSTRCG